MKLRTCCARPRFACAEKHTSHVTHSTIITRALTSLPSSYVCKCIWNLVQNITRLCQLICRPHIPVMVVVVGSNGRTPFPATSKRGPMFGGARNRPLGPYELVQFEKSPGWSSSFQENYQFGSLISKNWKMSTCNQRLSTCQTTIAHNESNFALNFL